MLSYYIITCWYFAYFVRIKFEFWYLMYIDGQWTFSKNVKFQINRITKKVMGILRQSAKLRSHQSNGFWPPCRIQNDLNSFELSILQDVQPVGIPTFWPNSYFCPTFCFYSYSLTKFLLSHLFRTKTTILGSIQESRPTRGSFRGSFCGSFCGSFAEVSASFCGSLAESSNKFLRNLTV